MTRLFSKDRRAEKGFTIPEVIVAGSILIVLCVGVMSAYVQAIKINRGNNLRMQALSVLQQEVEFYRSLKFIPVNSDEQLEARVYNDVRVRNSADGRAFSISVTITNLDGLDDANTTFKEITIEARPVITESEGWLQELNTKVTQQRVRSN
jgi:type II secretory pathway pseudopilin PulG